MPGRVNAAAPAGRGPAGGTFGNPTRDPARLNSLQKAWESFLEEPNPASEERLRILLASADPQSRIFGIANVTGRRPSYGPARRLEGPASRLAGGGQPRLPAPAPAAASPQGARLSAILSRLQRDRQPREGVAITPSDSLRRRYASGHPGRVAEEPIGTAPVLGMLSRIAENTKSELDITRRAWGSSSTGRTGGAAPGAGAGGFSPRFNKVFQQWFTRTMNANLNAAFRWMAKQPAGTYQNAQAFQQQATAYAAAALRGAAPWQQRPAAGGGRGGPPPGGGGGGRGFGGGFAGGFLAGRGLVGRTLGGIGEAGLVGWAIRQGIDLVKDVIMAPQELAGIAQGIGPRTQPYAGQQIRAYSLARAQGYGGQAQRLTDLFTVHAAGMSKVEYNRLKGWFDRTGATPDMMLQLREQYPLKGGRGGPAKDIGIAMALRESQLLGGFGGMESAAPQVAGFLATAGMLGKGAPAQISTAMNSINAQLIDAYSKGLDRSQVLKTIQSGIMSLAGRGMGGFNWNSVAGMMTPSMQVATPSGRLGILGQNMIEGLQGGISQIGQNPLKTQIAYGAMGRVTNWDQLTAVLGKDTVAKIRSGPMTRKAAEDMFNLIKSCQSAAALAGPMQTVLGANGGAGWYRLTTAFGQRAAAGMGLRGAAAQSYANVAGAAAGGYSYQAGIATQLGGGVGGGLQGGASSDTEALRRMGVPAQYIQAIQLAARSQGIDPKLLGAVMMHESGGDPNAIGAMVQGQGQARGLMQIMPGTAQMLSKQMGGKFTAAQIMNDPAANMLAGAYYIKELQGQNAGNTVGAMLQYGGFKSAAQPGAQSYLSDVERRMERVGATMGPGAGGIPETAFAIQSGVAISASNAAAASMFELANAALAAADKLNLVDAAIENNQNQPGTNLYEPGSIGPGFSP